ncbi:hypothetical protein OBCHQ24_17670 [Oceanobacillus iheyensis]|nr:hypothetical protein OBCHQ24_17670 [Oceanobacillus iheyensis]
MNSQLFQGFGQTMLEVGAALTPLLFLFLIFQVQLFRLSIKKILPIMTGFLFTFLGLSLFLQGVYLGFLPIGRLIGAELGTYDFIWLLLPIGFLLGFVATYAEPAVNVLIHQVERASRGYIPQKLLLYTISIGVGLSVAVAMLRLIIGISLWVFILPGYIATFLMMRYSSRAFISIAFDAGGVATGPMTATFILSMFVGIAGEIGETNPLLDGFGMVALVALAPILSVLTLGILFGRKERAH